MTRRKTQLLIVGIVAAILILSILILNTLLEPGRQAMRQNIQQIQTENAATIMATLMP